jgi:hypothetical protein
MPRTYSVNMAAASIAGSVTLIQIKPGISSVRIRRMKLAQSSGTTSAMQDVAYGTSTGAATVTTFTAKPHDLDGAAAKAVGGTSATGITATVEGSGQTDIDRDTFNVLNGWEKIFTDDEMIEIPGGGSVFFYLRLPSLTTNPTTFNALVTFQEIG